MARPESSSTTPTLLPSSALPRPAVRKPAHPTCCLGGALHRNSRDMTAPDDIRALLRAHLADPASQWNLGTFGAIAEFMRGSNEPVQLADKTHLLAATTARGGIGFRNLTGVTPFASESATGQGWSHRLALCLPETACAMSRRTVLTELGPDGDALREQDREGLLFDMGLDTLQVDISIRTSTPGLIAA